MLLSRRDEIAVTIPRCCPNTPNSKIFSLYPIFSLHFSLFVPQRVFSFLFPPHLRLCVLGSVMSWFGFPSPATGIFFFLSPSSSRTSPLPPHPLSCFLLSMPPLSPKDCPGCLFSVFLPSSAFTILYIYIYIHICIPMVLENPTHMGLSAGVAHVRPVWSSSVLKVWKMHEHLYHCPEARHRQHHPQLCGRMFKWEALHRTRCITRQRTCKHTAV